MYAGYCRMSGMSAEKDVKERGLWGWGVTDDSLLTHVELILSFFFLSFFPCTDRRHRTSFS